MQQGTYTGIQALAASLWRAVQHRERLLRMLEDIVFTFVLIFALSAWINTGSIPYYAFLLAGLAPWFYLKEIFMDAPGLPAIYTAVLKDTRWNMSWLPFAKAFAALPVLLFWTLIAIISAYLTGAQVSLNLLPYIVLCNLCNGIAQGLVAAAFAPLFPVAAHGTVAITLPLLFWTMPIVWPAYILPDFMLNYTRLNPFFYLTEGMRDALFASSLPSSAHTLLFFGITLVIGAFGLLVMLFVWRAPLSQEKRHQ